MSPGEALSCTFACNYLDLACDQTGYSAFKDNATKFLEIQSTVKFLNLSFVRGNLSNPGTPCPASKNVADLDQCDTQRPCNATIMLEDDEYGQTAQDDYYFRNYCTFGYNPGIDNCNNSYVGYTTICPCVVPGPPTLAPTDSPTTEPTFSPSTLPTAEPTYAPSTGPTPEPTEHPTAFPTEFPPTLGPSSTQPTKVVTSFTCTQQLSGLNASQFQGDKSAAQILTAAVQQAITTSDEWRDLEGSIQRVNFVGVIDGSPSKHRQLLADQYVTVTYEVVFFNLDDTRISDNLFYEVTQQAIALGFSASFASIASLANNALLKTAKVGAFKPVSGRGFPFGVPTHRPTRSPTRPTSSPTTIEQKHLDHIQNRIDKILAPTLPPTAKPSSKEIFVLEQRREKLENSLKNLRENQRENRFSVTPSTKPTVSPSDEPTYLPTTSKPTLVPSHRPYNEEHHDEHHEEHDEKSLRDLEKRLEELRGDKERKRDHESKKVAL